MDFQSNKISVLAKPELSEFLSHLFSGKVSINNLTLVLDLRFKNILADLFKNVVYIVIINFIDDSHTYLMDRRQRR